jgi:hypothetical protein
MTKTTYTNIGSVRGSCGHNHRTISGALRCLDSDQSGCRQCGGYSDRVVRVGGKGGIVVPTMRDDDGDLVVDWADVDGHPDEDAIRDALTSAPAGYPSDY